MSIGTDQGEVLIPTVINGRVVSDQEAIDYYNKTGENFGTFRSPDDATAFAKSLHQKHERELGRRPSGVNLDQLTAGAESGNRDFYASGQPVVSPKGARFAMQVMPETARDPGFGLKPANPNDPNDMNRLGREYRAAMEQRYGGDLQRMWASYNAGPGRVDSLIAKYGDDWLRYAPAETQQYVAGLMRRAGR